MGMFDQYDDGRYDYDGKVVGMEVYNAETNEWLPAGDPRLPKPRRSNGWNQVNTRPAPELHPRFHYDPGFGYGLDTILNEPITAVRGGIKYPTPTKETHMPEPRMTKAQIDHELQSNAQLQEMLRQRRLELQRQKEKAIPAEPLNYLMFTVAVKFKMRGKAYQYLILRNGNAYFTTGTNTGQKMFPTWEALVAWLEGPEVYSHSDIEILKSAGKAVSFDTGAIERMDPSDQKPPF